MRIALLVSGAVLAVIVAGAPDPARADLPPSVVFEDRTRAAKLWSPQPSLDPLKGAYVHGAAWGDPDGDGDSDLFVGTFASSSPSTYQQRGATEAMPNRLFLYEGRGRFAPAPQETAAVLATLGQVSGALFADLDGDGDEDLVVTENRLPASHPQAGNPTRRQPTRLYENLGGADFVERTDSGLDGEHLVGSRTVLALDHDADGCLDLYVVNDQFFRNDSPSRLLRGDCALHFTDVTHAAGLATASGLVVHGLGAAVADVDGDRWPDLFVAGGPRGHTTATRGTLDRRSFLFLNQRDGTFEEVLPGVFDEPHGGHALEDWTSGAAFGDLDRDGRLDLVVAHHFQSAMDGSPKAPRVWLNRTPPGGPVAFLDVTEASGIGAVSSKSPHVDVLDFDNNGWLDVYVSVEVDVDGSGDVAPQPLVFRNTGPDVDGVPQLRAPDGFTPDSDTRYWASAPAEDIEGDGRIDVFGGEWDPGRISTLYRNVGKSGSWLTVDVRDGERAALGARVSVFRSGRAGVASARLFTGEVQAGNGFASSRRALVHAGLGTVGVVDVVIEPPFGGAPVVIVGQRANRRIAVTLP